MRGRRHVTADTLALLAALPRLAAASVPRNQGRTGGGDGIRTAPGSKPPPGVDLDAIDVSHGRQHPHLLARLSGCVRAVVEERRRADLWHPEPVAEEDVSWATEVQYLLDTADWWTADSWCVEWIGTEVAAIHRKLGGKLERRLPDGTRRCSVCGEELLLRTTRTLAWAECDKCARVVAMGERVTLTTKQAADVLGITPEGVRKRVERGQLARTDDGKVAGDALDWARRKLGLPTAGEAC